ncbi:MAG: signal peptidase I [Bacteroidota bacterium]
MQSFNSELFLILWVICFVLTRVGLSKMFKAAGQSAGMAWIPALSWWYWIKIVDRPKWYMLGMVIPGLNILFSFNITLDMLRSFGKHGYWEQLFGTVFSFVYFPILAFKPMKYYGPAGNKAWKEANVPKQDGIREWGDAILFAAYVAGGMRALYFDLYQIPTPSMESNLMVGDYLVVSRAKIGMRIPMTPITVPVMAPKQIMGVKAYTDLLELPYMRLPGWYTIKNNDVIVFNWPTDDDADADGLSDYQQTDDGITLSLPADKKDNYVKRCVGIPGDRIKLVGGQIYVNDKLLPRIGKQQKRFLALLKTPITEDFLEQNELGDFNFPPNAKLIQDAAQKTGKYIIPYHLFTWPENYEKLKNHPEVMSIFLDSIDEGYQRVMFPGNVRFNGQLLDNHADTSLYDFAHPNWNINNYGEVRLPKRGETIALTAQNWDFLKLAINKYEHGKIVQRGGKFYSNNGQGSEVKSYTFKMGYYWMIGDNRYNSLDSRFWGYVPEDHVVGKPLFTFFSLKKVMSIDSETNQPLTTNGNMEYKVKGIRWSKIFSWIE